MIGIVLGSGLGPLAEAVLVEREVPFADAGLPVLSAIESLRASVSVMDRAAATQARQTVKDATRAGQEAREAL